MLKALDIPVYINIKYSVFFFSNWKNNMGVYPTPYKLYFIQRFVPVTCEISYLINHA